MESIISTFHIDWKIIITQMINISIVFFVLYIYAIKPLFKMMEERSEKISKGISDAKTNEDTLKETTAKYEEALTKARIEANKICENGKKEAEIEKTKLIEGAKSQVEVLIQNGKKTLEAEKVKMMNEVKKEIVSLVMVTTEKLVGKNQINFNEKVLKDLENL